MLVINHLLASVFTSTLGSPVVTYDQYKKEEEEKKHVTYFQPVNVDQLFIASQLHGKVGERQDAACSKFEVYKDKIHNEDSVPPDQQRLIFADR